MREMGGLKWVRGIDCETFTVKYWMYPSLLASVVIGFHGSAWNDTGGRVEAVDLFPNSDTLQEHRMPT